MKLSGMKLSGERLVKAAVDGNLGISSGVLKSCQGRRVVTVCTYHVVASGMSCWSRHIIMRRHELYIPVPCFYLLATSDMCIMPVYVLG